MILKKTVDDPRIKAVEAENPPTYIVRILGKDNREQGLYLLQVGKRLKVVALYDYPGIHHVLPEGQLILKDEQLSAGLQDLPPDVTLTVEHECFRQRLNREQLLRQLQRTGNREMQVLILDGAKTKKRLTRSGRRLGRKITISVAFDIGAKRDSYSALTDRIIDLLQKTWTRLNGSEDEARERDFQQVFQAIVERLEDVDSRLINKMGLAGLTPFSAQGCYERFMGEISDDYDRQIPHLITYNVLSGNLTETTKQELDIRTYRLKNSVPVALADAVHIKGKYVAVMVLEQKPKGWNDAQHCLHYVWDIIKDFPDLKVVTQLRASENQGYRASLEWMEKLSRGQLFQNNVTNTQAELAVEDALNTRRRLTGGAKPFVFAVVILVYRDSREQLLQACRALAHRVQLPALLTRERHYTWKLYQEAQPYSKHPLLVIPLNRRLTELSDAITPFLPLILPHSPSQRGFELITEGGTPIHLDVSGLKHIAVFASTRAGKSVLIASMLQYVLCQGTPVMIMDFPGPDGVSTFNQFVNALAGAYLNIREQALNLFELPSPDYLPYLTCPTETAAMTDFKNSLVQVLVALVMGTEAESRQRQQRIETLIGIGVSQFLSHPEVQQRYRQAYQGGFGSEGWSKIPTLLDFIAFLVPQSFAVEDIDLRELGEVKGRLQYLSQGVCRALARPSTIRQNEAQILAYALTNISSDEEAFVYGLMFYLLVLRRALKYGRQIVFVDEASILFKYNSLSNLFGRLQANGAKFGVSLWLAAQDADTIYHSAAGRQIFANLSTILIGRIKPTAIETLEQIQHYDRQLLIKNTSEEFGQNPYELSSQWLLDDNEGHMCHCKAFISPVLLAMVANNPKERRARSLLLEHYSEPLKGLVHFAAILRHAFSTNTAVDEVVVELIARAGDGAVPDYIEQWRKAG